MKRVKKLPLNLKMEAVVFFGKLVNFCQATQQHIPEGKGLIGRHGWCECCAEERNLCLSWESNSGRPSHSPVTVLTAELFNA
jgi:hypothetical protein